MKALILVDLQNDFFPGGALEVKGGDRILFAINELLKMSFDLVVATKDWHPKGHISFASTHHKKPGEMIEVRGVPQILWRDHCVQGTQGSEFAPGWPSERVNEVFLKGTSHDIDSYSTFFDNGHLKSTGLEDYLRKNQIDTIYLAGLTTEYCVAYSALDALELGFKVYVVEEGCCGVELHPGDSQRAIEKMKKAGVKFFSITNS